MRPALRLEPLEPRDVPALALDPAYGTGGRVGLADGRALADLAALPDGAVVGVGRNPTATAFVVAKFRPDGSPDPGFAGGGVTAVPFDTFAVGQAVAVRADGKLLAAGTLQRATPEGGFTADYAVARLNPDGTPDPSFGPGGVRVVDVGGIDQLTDVFALPDGRVLLVGTTVGPAGGQPPALVRLNPDGSRDTFFGDGGTAVVPGVPFIGSAALQPDGRLVYATGTAVGRLTAAGTPDPTFATNGLDSFPRDGRIEVGRVSLTAGGKVLVAGTVVRHTPATGFQDDVFVARLNADGTPDAGFGTAGGAVVDLGGWEAGRAAVPRDDGSVLVVGGSGGKLAVAVLSPAGVPWPGRQATIDLGRPGRLLPADAVATPGRVVVAGGEAVDQLLGVVEAFPYGNDAIVPLPLAAATNPFPGVAVRSAVGDVDGDGFADTVFVTGPGTPLRAAVVSGRDGSTLVPPFDPFGDGFAGGGYVAAGDLDGDGSAEWVVTPDAGGGPRVAVFSLVGGDALVPRANFFAFDDPTFRGGVRVAAGDVNRDGAADLIVAAGDGGGPRVAVLDGRVAATGWVARLAADFFAFAPDLRTGATVAVTDADADGHADLVLGAGAGGGPHVLTVGGRQLMERGFGAVAAPLGSRFAGDPAGRDGVTVTTADADRDGTAEVVMATPTPSAS